MSRLARLLACSLALASRSGDVAAAPPEPLVVEQPRLLLLVDEGELAFSIERAIQTELNDIEVALDVMPLVHAYDLRDRIGVAEHEVAERGSLGAVWVEVEDDALVVVLVVAQAGMVRRSIAGESPAAQVEAAAVVIRHFTADLLEGRSIGLTRLDDADDADDADEPDEAASPEGPAAPEGPRIPITDRSPVEPAPLEPWRMGARGRVRLQVGYFGHAWAPQRRWASGVELDVGWRARVGVHVDLAYTVLGVYSDTIPHPSGSGVAEIVVRRYSPALVIGYQHVWDPPRIALDAQLRLVTEVVDRRASDPIGDLPIALDPRLVLAPAIEPRLQFDWVFRPPLSLNLALGLRINTIDYTYGLNIEDDMGNPIGSDVYLRPNLIAPTLQIGLGVAL